MVSMVMRTEDRAMALRDTLKKGTGQKEHQMHGQHHAEKPQMKIATQNRQSQEKTREQAPLHLQAR